MDLLERARQHLKDIEFRLSPAMVRALRPLSRTADPYREADHRLRCIFIHVPKAAGTSVARAIFDDRSRHVPLTRYHAFDPQAAAAYFKFAFVRNPWNRFRSAHAYLARRIGADPRWPDHRWATHYLRGCAEFPDFVARLRTSAAFRRAVRRYIHFRDQLDWLTVNGRIGVDFLGRYENMTADFAAVCARLGIDATLPHERTGDGVAYRDVYDDASRDFVAELYRRDIDALGYRFGS